MSDRFRLLSDFDPDAAEAADRALHAWRRRWEAEHGPITGADVTDEGSPYRVARDVAFRAEYEAALRRRAMRVME